MTNYAHTGLAKAELEKFIVILGDQKTRLGIAKKMSVPVLYAARALAPVGTKVNKRYRRRKKKGTKNRRPRVWQVTQPGNLRRSHDAVPVFANYRVGPHVSEPAKNFAFYAWAVHARVTPWLKRAEQQSEQAAQKIGIEEVRKLIEKK